MCIHSFVFVDSSNVLKQVRNVFRQTKEVHCDTFLLGNNPWASAYVLATSTGQADKLHVILVQGLTHKYDT